MLHGSHGQIERAQRVIEADAAFVHGAIVFENVGLSGLPAAECPQQRNRERLGPRLTVRMLPPARRDDGRFVRALLERELGVLVRMAQASTVSSACAMGVARKCAVCAAWQAAQGNPAAAAEKGRAASRQSQPHFPLAPGSAACFSAFRRSTMARSLSPSSLRLSR